MLELLVVLIVVGVICLLACSAHDNNQEETAQKTFDHLKSNYHSKFLDD
jgi:Tfp pilus assembly protein PilE